MGNYYEAKGLIFNIVHGSFVDGWGVRTTIFLKGCPLRCLWCCNPEGQKMDPELKLSADKCTGCGDCIPICPQGALSMSDTGVVVADRSRCTGCGDCVDACAYDALEIWGQWYTAREMFEIIKKDEPFYKASGGGLTIGGGEATLYPEFCLGLIDLCRQNGVNVAIDTCGYATAELGREALRQADFLLFDIKGLDDIQHKADTFVSNRTILDNFEMLASIDKPLIIRYPAIPRHNASDDQLNKTAEFLSGYKNIKRVDIIPYHQFGIVKYEQLGMKYVLNEASDSDERQEEMKAIFESWGLTAQIGG